MQADRDDRVAREVAGLRVLVSGGTGSFGRLIIRRLLSLEPAEVVVFSRDEHKQYRLAAAYADHPKRERLRFVLGDVRDRERTFETARGVDVVLHAAALKQVPHCELHPLEAVKTNVLGAQNVRDAAIAGGVAKVIGISTDKAVAPAGAMGMTKALQEKLLVAEGGRVEGTRLGMVRFGNVVASRGSVVLSFLEKIERRQPLPITHAEMTRFFLAPRDAVDFFFRVLCEMQGGEIFVRKAHACRIPELARTMGEHFAGDSHYPIEVTGLRPGEKLHETLVSRAEMPRTRREPDGYVIGPAGVTPAGPTGDPEEYTSRDAPHLDGAGIVKLLESSDLEPRSPAHEW